MAWSVQIFNIHFQCGLEGARGLWGQEAFSRGACVPVDCLKQERNCTGEGFSLPGRCQILNRRGSLKIVVPGSDQKTRLGG